MAVSLLASKLFVPPARPELVPRPRLIERLNADLERDGRFARRLSLICAPAGFGKTTLASTWLSTLPHPHAWIALDQGDNDPTRFSAYLVAALQTIDAEVGQTVQQASQPPSPETLLTSLINDIAATPHPFVLVLDDYHLIHTPPIHQQLAFLVEHQPPQMHLVIATREEPPLPLSSIWTWVGSSTKERAIKSIKSFKTHLPEVHRYKEV